MYHVPVDDYVIDVLLPDLAGHDRSPSAFLVYLVLWTHLFRSERRAVAVSLQRLAAETGLSKSAVQAAIRLLHSRSPGLRAQRCRSMSWSGTGCGGAPRSSKIGDRFGPGGLP
jgi:helix-turn-helix protein